VTERESKRAREQESKRARERESERAGERESESEREGGREGGGGIHLLSSCHCLLTGHRQQKIREMLPAGQNNYALTKKPKKK